MKENLGKEFSAQEIRVAALSNLYKMEPFEKYVSKISKKLQPEQRMSILNALVAVLGSDGGIGALEADFFNSVVASLHLTPAQIIGLQK